LLASAASSYLRPLASTHLISSCQGFFCQGVLLAQGSRNPVVKSLIRTVIPLIVRSPLLSRMQRRLFFGAPLPPLDPAFSFRNG
jgi:hypothetical protein